MRDVTFDGYHLPTLAKLAWKLDKPTDDKFAEFIWRLSNTPTLPVEIATEFMEAAGYVPFAGFPLQLVMHVCDLTGARVFGAKTHCPCTTGWVKK